MQGGPYILKLADHKQNVDSLWVPESWGREAFTSLGALSQVTTKVKLGTSIIGIYTRSPATTAMGSYYLGYPFQKWNNNRTWGKYTSLSRKLAWFEIRRPNT